MMNIKNHYPLTNGLLTDLDRFVNQALGATVKQGAESDRCTGEATACTSVESDEVEGWKLRLELPGYAKDEVKVSVNDGYLRIDAATVDEERGFLKPVTRRIRLSDEADASSTVARLENGILFLEIPRRLKEAPLSIVVK